MPDPHMHVKLHPLNLPALKAGPCGPHLCILIGEALGGGGISKGVETSPQPKQTKKHCRIDAENLTFSNTIFIWKEIIWGNFKYMPGILGASS